MDKGEINTEENQLTNLQNHIKITERDKERQIKP